MKRYRPILIILPALAFTPVASAQIFKCDGPEGPIYTDQKCGPDATNVEISDTSGVSGVSDETKAELAQKKADREKSRNSGNNAAVNNNQYNTLSTEPAGRWTRRPYERPGRKASSVPSASQQPAKGATVKRRR
ncbi:MAG: hypothetical protein OEU84_17545 [Xanthomonadales bacterium]|nr:hypothetical protein [Xanthomonadales bacterium]